MRRNKILSFFIFSICLILLFCCSKNKESKQDYKNVSAVQNENKKENSKENVKENATKQQSEKAENSTTKENKTVEAVEMTSSANALSQNSKNETDKNSEKNEKQNQVLTGHDKHLSEKPYSQIYPSDFEIGKLYTFTDSKIDAILLRLEKGFIDGKLNFDDFSPELTPIIKIRFDEIFLTPNSIKEIRFACPNSSGSVKTFPFRIITENMAKWTNGIVLISENNGNYKIEYLDFDSNFLSEIKTRSEEWDPYIQVNF